MSALFESLAVPNRPKSILNFRRVLPTGDESPDVTAGPAVLYRSSRLDQLPEEEAEWFHKNGIRTIIDCRSLTCYRGLSTEKHLEKYYTIQDVCLPFLRWRYHVTEKVRSRPCAANQNKDRKNYFLMDFFRLDIFISILCSIPWLYRIPALWYFFKSLWYKDEPPEFFLYSEARWPRGIGGFYKAFLDSSQSAIAAALKLLSEPGSLPAVITCHYGKDRTGVLVALLLALLGKDRDYIAQDYVLSTADARNRDHMKEEQAKFNLPASVTGADKSAILGVIDHIEERYGGIEAYLEHCGFGMEEQETLKRNIAGKLKQT